MSTDVRLSAVAHEDWPHAGPGATTAAAAADAMQGRRLGSPPQWQPHTGGAASTTVFTTGVEGGGWGQAPITVADLIGLDPLTAATTPGASGPGWERRAATVATRSSDWTPPGPMGLWLPQPTTREPNLAAAMTWICGGGGEWSMGHAPLTVEELIGISAPVGQASTPAWPGGVRAAAIAAAAAPRPFGSGPSWYGDLGDVNRDEGTAMYAPHQPRPAAHAPRVGGKQVMRRRRSTGSNQPLRLPPAGGAVLQSWLQAHAAHPYPTKDEKRALMAAAGVAQPRLDNWFASARARRRVAQHAQVDDSGTAVDATDAEAATTMTRSEPPDPAPEFDIADV